MKHLFKALAEFQQSVPVIFKGATAGKGNYSYQYADLPSIFNVINPLLKDHGLGFTQVTNHIDGSDYLVTILFHVESGEMIDTKLRLIPANELQAQNVFQSYGAQLTYFRRYGISQILGLVTDVDTDAENLQTKPKQTETLIKEVKPTLTVPQFNKLIGLIQTNSVTKSGEVYSVDYAKKVYTLSEEQLLTLNEL